MSTRAHSRFFVLLALAVGPLLSIAACGGDGDDSGAVQEEDAATDDVVTIDSSFPDDADLDAQARDGSKDARSDAHSDASAPDAAKTANRCGGYATLEYAGSPTTPGDSCGACHDGTIACIGSDSVACAGATSPPCATPPVDAGPNACGGYGPLTFLAADAAVGDVCGECGSIQCASTNALTCLSLGSYCATDAGLASTCVIPEAAYDATIPSPLLPAETRPTTTSTSAIALPASALAFNPYDGHIYASISQGVSQGNSIVAIDPTTATVLHTVYVGPSPTVIALSDDGKALWVVVTGQYGNGPPSIRRVDLTTFSVGTTIALPTNTGITGLQVLAGTEDSIAVSTSFYGYPSYQYVYATVIYDNGLPRLYGARELGQVQEFAPASVPLVLVNAANSYTVAQVSSVCVDAKGAFFQGSVGTTTSSYYSSPFLYQGVIYASDGTSYDARTLAALHNFGSTTAPMTASIAADAKDVYFLTVVSKSVGYQAMVAGFDRTTFAATSTDVLGPSDYYSARSFIRWGRYGFAYLNGTTSIEIARSTIIPDQP